MKLSQSIIKTFSSSRVNTGNLRNLTVLTKIQNGRAKAVSWGLDQPHYIKNRNGKAWLRVKVVAFVDSYPVFSYTDIKGVDVTSVVNMSIELHNFRSSLKKAA